MAIEKYWGNYIGGTDDSLTLLDYLVGKQKDEIPLREIFADTGLDKLNWNFRNTEVPLEYKDKEGWEHEFDFAIDPCYRSGRATVRMPGQWEGPFSVNPESCFRSDNSDNDYFRGERFDE